MTSLIAHIRELNDEQLDELISETAKYHVGSDPYHDDVYKALRELRLLRNNAEALLDVVDAAMGLRDAAQRVFDKGYEIPQKMDTAFFQTYLADILDMRHALTKFDEAKRKVAE